MAVRVQIGRFAFHGEWGTGRSYGVVVWFGRMRWSVRIEFCPRVLPPVVSRFFPSVFHQVELA